MVEDDEITPDRLKELLDRGEEVRVVDIRSPAQFHRGHIPGSENVAFHELPRRVDSLSGSDHIVTVCPHGKASLQAARLIASYEGTSDALVESLRGGIDEWEYDLESGDDDLEENDERSGEEASRRTERAPF